jgi:hypothetical protein
MFAAYASTEHRLTIRVLVPGDGGFLFRLRNVTILGYFYYLIIPKLLHVLVVRPSSSRDILAKITRLRCQSSNPIYFYYLILPKLLHVSVVRPSSGKNILPTITSLKVVLANPS